MRNKKKLVVFYLILLLYAFQNSSAQSSCKQLDVFGISQFYNTKPGSREWNSLHWNNGVDRTVKYASDQYDPTDWTEDHSGSTNGFHIDGKGVMNMSGGSPRFHINSTRTGKVSAQLFLNTEYTAYYRRIGTSGGIAYGGMIVGARSGPLGHASSGGNDCDATTYYARFRHDGKWDFEKELQHPTSDYWSGSGFHTQDPLWKGSILTENRWIGMKYLIYNIENNTKVKMELYLDSVSNGNPINGGTWVKVGEVIDQGNWPVQASAITGCSYTDPKTIILTGHGTFLMRTDGDQAEYKMVSIREIDINSPVTCKDCNGVNGGTAYLDSCNICVGGNTGKNACVTQKIFLSPGWNLVSFNVEPKNKSIDSVFANISGMIEIKNADGFYKTGSQSYLQSLTQIAIGGSYLVKMSTSALLQIRGNSSISGSLLLKKGWNMVECPWQTSKTINSILSSTVCQVQRMKDFDAFYDSTLLGNLTTILPNKGYFMFVNADCLFNW